MSQPVPNAMERLASVELHNAALEKRLAEIEAFVAILRAAIGGASANGVGAVATDTDLDGRYGDPKVKLSPRDWQGAPRKGWQMSRCEPDFLDLYAETLEYFARKNDESGKKASNGKPASTYDRADAARARGWAKRLRNGWQPPQGTPATGGAPKRWGTSGWGANAKHTGTPERTEDTYAKSGGEWEPPSEEPEGTDEDDSIPFISTAARAPRHLRRRHLWERF